MRVHADDPNEAHLWSQELFQLSFPFPNSEGDTFPMTGASLIVWLVKNPPAMQETPVLFLRLGRSAGEGMGYPLQYSWTSFVAQLVKNPSCNAGDLGLIPGLGRCPGEGKCYPLQYSGWRIPWTVQSMGSQRVGHD